MESSDLFSHPYEPEAVAKREANTEPTEMPAFSDRPEKNSSASKPSQ
jgi:hypothetical protein